MIKKLVIEVTQRTNDALERRKTTNGMNKTTICNRAVQVYDLIEETAAKLLPGYKQAWLLESAHGELISLRIKRVRPYGPFARRMISAYVFLGDLFNIRRKPSN